MKKKNLYLIVTVLAIAGITSTGLSFASSEKSVRPSDAEIKQVAERFIQVVDDNDAEALKELLHPQLIQYVQMGDKLIPFKAADFIQMVADKKIGGVPRKVTFKSSDVVRGGTGYVLLNAVSNEYDFMYQLSIAQSEGEWLIVGILVDIIKF